MVFMILKEMKAKKKQLLCNEVIVARDVMD